MLIAHDKDRAGRLQEVREHLARLGKKRGAIIAHLVDAGGSATMQELLGRFAGSRTRPRDFHRRTLAMMEDPAIVVVEGELVRLAEGWREALEHARELGREQEAADRQRVNHELQRAAFRRPDRDWVSNHPANAEVPGDAWVEELEKLPEPPAPELLYRLMAERVPVGTPKGEGLLWQVFSDRVGVVLDGGSGVVTFMHPAELVLEGASA